MIHPKGVSRLQNYIKLKQLTEPDSRLRITSLTAHLDNGLELDLSTPSQLSAILETAVRITNRADRQLFLEKIYGNDLEMIEKVEAMVEGFFEADSMINAKKPETEVNVSLQSRLSSFGFGGDASNVQSSNDSEPFGTMVGPYMLTELLGEGGFGLVYVAEQQHPVHRTVAVKLIKPGMDSKEILSRFERERQSLAVMDHPAIAKILDAGTTVDGRPYFAMELVSGIPITRYCDQNRLAIEQRLELFMQLCEAVHHAHQKGIVHRDLKPSNLLVEDQAGKPVIKIIDFGIAKAINQSLFRDESRTQHGQVVGTPIYMSPEQATSSNKTDVDARSDIYSLGVVLFELLTGSTPITRDQLRADGPEATYRRIREEDCPLPSSRLTQSGNLQQIADQRRANEIRLTRLVQGDLDWITSRALERERARRYDSASAFRQDIRRFLANDPIEASPPSAKYRLKKFYQKHRISLLTAFAIAMVLIGSTIVSTTFAFWALRAKDRAEQNEAQTKIEKEQRELALSEKNEALKKMTDAVHSETLAKEKELKERRNTEFVLSCFLHSFLPGSENNDAPSVESVAERAKLALNLGADIPPNVQATLHYAIGSMYMGRNDYRAAISQLSKALKLRVQSVGDDHPQTNEVKAAYATCLLGLNQVPLSNNLFREVIYSDRVDGAYYEHSVLGLHMPNMELKYLERLIESNNDELAEILIRESFEQYVEKFGANSVRALEVWQLLCDLHLKRGENQEALSLANQIYKKSSQSLGDSHRVTLSALRHRGQSEFATGNHSKALTLLFSALQLQSKENRSTGKPSSANAQDIFVFCERCFEAGEVEIANQIIGPLAQRISDGRDSGAIDVEVLLLQGKIRLKLGDLKAADQAFSKAAQDSRFLNRNHADLAMKARFELARFKLVTRRYDEVLDLLPDREELSRETKDLPWRLKLIATVGCAMKWIDRADEGVDLVESAYADAVNIYGAEHEISKEVSHRLKWVAFGTQHEPTHFSLLEQVHVRLSKLAKLAFEARIERRLNSLLSIPRGRSLIDAKPFVRLLRIAKKKTSYLDGVPSEVAIRIQVANELVRRNEICDAQHALTPILVEPPFQLPNEWHRQILLRRLIEIYTLDAKTNNNPSNRVSIWQSIEKINLMSINFFNELEIPFADARSLHLETLASLTKACESLNKKADAERWRKQYQELVNSPWDQTNTRSPSHTDDFQQ